MAKLFFKILLIASIVLFASAIICKERGPKLCNRQLLSQISLICNGLNNAEFLTSVEGLPRCCCSFGCSDTYLMKTVCPSQIV